MRSVAQIPRLAAFWDATRNAPLRPNDVSFGSSRRVVWWRCPAGPDHVWQAPPNRLGSGGGCPFCAGARFSITNSLAVRFPDVARQWHPTKNGELTASVVRAYERRKVWWQCAADPAHEWLALIGNRTHLGAGCPFCKGRRPDGRTSLAALAPEVAREWHPTKNGRLTPTDVRSRSGRHVWWQCSRHAEHIWRTAIEPRVAKGRGCPTCARRRVKPERTLSHARPDLAAEWHPLKNSRLTPDDVSYGTNRRVWWRCSQDSSHEWVSPPASRLRRGCPFCSRRRVSAANALALHFPEIAAQWHPSKNGARRPEHFSSYSSVNAWWLCPKNRRHVWLAAIRVRSTLGPKCPMCSGRTFTPERSLAQTRPQIARQWHPTRNGRLTPRDVWPSTSTRIWWRCEAGADHIWQATLNSRTVSSSGCPFCAGRRVSVTNSLASLRPDLAKQWDHTKNASLRPRDVTTGSRTAVWWRCRKGPDHRWSATVASRTHVRDPRCPFCAGRRVSVTNSLMTVAPKLAEEWHAAKNGGLRPADVVAASNTLVWWQCARGHGWKATPRERIVRRRGCPACAMDL